jgi:hypothetical protein
LHPSCESRPDFSARNTVHEVSWVLCLELTGGHSEELKPFMSRPDCVSVPIGKLTEFRVDLKHIWVLCPDILNYNNYIDGAGAKSTGYWRWILEIHFMWDFSAKILRLRCHVKAESNFTASSVIVGPCVLGYLYLLSCLQQHDPLMTLILLPWDGLKLSHARYAPGFKSRSAHVRNRHVMGIGFLLNSTLVGMSCMMVGFLCVCVCVCFVDEVASIVHLC